MKCAGFENTNKGVKLFANALQSAMLHHENDKIKKRKNKIILNITNKYGSEPFETTFSTVFGRPIANPLLWSHLNPLPHLWL